MRASIAVLVLEVCPFLSPDRAKYMLVTLR
jgi:hypothetical protein